MLVGRDAERSLVDRLVAGARLGVSAVLAVTGEVGVGKTALLEHARAVMSDFLILTATGTRPEQDIPFAGLLTVLRPALAHLAEIPVPQAHALSVALALTDGSAGDRFAIGAATLSLLARCAEDGPLAVIVDDLHLLDRPSAEALTFAARRLTDDTVVVLLAARPGECDDVLQGVPHLPLTGLPLAESGQLVRAVAGFPVTDQQVAWLHEHTAGNPLALIELGTDPLTVDPADSGVPPRIPSGVAESFDHRIRALDPPSRTALLVAVVANGDVRLAAAALGGSAPELGPAEAAGLLTVSGGQVQFRHPLVRAAVYAAADESARRAAHRAVADALPPADVDRRAWHLSESGWPPDPAVAALLAAAAEHAAARSAYAVAATAWERASRWSLQPQQSAERMLRAAENAWLAGLVPRAGALLDEVAASEATTSQALAAVSLRAAIAARTGALVEARDMLERAAATQQDPDVIVTLLSDAIHAALYLGDGAGAQRLAAALARTLPHAVTPLSRAVGLFGVGMAAVLTGRGGGAPEIREALPLLLDSLDLDRDSRRVSWLLLASLFLRDSTPAALHLRSLADAIRHRAGVGTLPHVLFHIARDQATTSAWARAEANYVEALRLARETGQVTEEAACLAGLAILEARRGRADACREYAAEALPLSADRGILFVECWVYAALGDLTLSYGNADEAVAWFERLEDTLTRAGLADPDLSCAPEHADALIRLGREQDAGRVVAAYELLAEAKGRPWAAARALRARGLLVPAAEIDDCFAGALALHEQTPDRFETARTQLAYGSRLRRLGRRVDARPHLREALAEFTELGAGRWGEVTAAELEATGERIPRRELDGTVALTPQELQVSLLLAEGRSTRETAAALFLSPKTVEYHLRKVYTKLGIHTRAELMAWLPADPRANTPGE